VSFPWTVGVVLPEDPLVSLPAPVSQLLLSRLSVRLRAGRHLSGDAGGRDGRAPAGPRPAPSGASADGPGDRHETDAALLRQEPPVHAAPDCRVLRRDPVRRLRGALFHLGELSLHLPLPSVAEGRPV